MSRVRKWNTRFKELLSYRSEHGDCDVPARHGELGQWVHKQRGAYKAGSLAQGRIDRLNNVGFKWSLKKSSRSYSTVPWATRFNELVRYKAKLGDCHVPWRTGYLGTWVKQQRRAYTGGSLAKDRIDRLSSIGFKWALNKGRGAKVPWETRFGELVQYKAKLGDCDVPWRTGNLGTWVKQQRRAYTGGSLAQDRIDRLDDIGFDWTPHRGSRKRKAAPSTSIRKQSLSRKKRVSSSSTNVDSRSVRDGSRCVEPGGFKGEGRKVPSKRSDHNRGTESDDEVDEIGALIYDQVMRQRQPKL